MRTRTKVIIGGAAGLLVIGAVASGGNDDQSDGKPLDTPKPSAQGAPKAPKDEPKAKAADEVTFTVKAKNVTGENEYLARSVNVDLFGGANVSKNFDGTKGWKGDTFTLTLPIDSKTNTVSVFAMVPDGEVTCTVTVGKAQKVGTGSGNMATCDASMSNFLGEWGE